MALTSGTSSILQLSESAYILTEMKWGPFTGSHLVNIRLLSHAYFDCHTVSFCMATIFSKPSIASETVRN